ncbi:hypothetical protein TNCV_1138501 [Trichonephila clavipes]|nr:hypothetical protein TNCV_1138501 [Trichonephila clavipes]
MRNSFSEIILPKPPKPDRYSRDVLHAAYSYDMYAVNFLHHENPPTWAGIDPATLGLQVQRKTNYATQPAQEWM